MLVLKAKTATPRKPTFGPHKPYAVHVREIREILVRENEVQLRTNNIYSILDFKGVNV